jgi:pyruvate formate lyase activating enzyme
MKLGGFQKLSLLDYPDKLSAIIWTIGCNFRCPFCYNKEIVFGKVDAIPQEAIFEYLEKRKKLLEGLVITGGEPTLQPDLKEFTKHVKQIGYQIKIDTNGSNPTQIKDLIDNRLVDYISMDIKAPKERYEKLAGCKVDLKKIEKSIELIKQEAPDYEFRTTFTPKLLEKKDILEIAKWLKTSKKYYLQQFEQKHPLISSAMEEVIPYPTEYLQETLEEIKPYFKECGLRGT